MKSVTISPNNLKGRKITKIIKCGGSPEVVEVLSGGVPSDPHWNNTFIVKGKGCTLLVLDTYGMGDLMSPTSIGPEILIKLLSNVVEEGKFTVALERETGHVFLATFCSSGKSVEMHLILLEDFIVSIPCVDRLWKASPKMKRPFDFAIDSQKLVLFITREFGYNDLRRCIYVAFELPRTKAGARSLHVGAGFQRMVTTT